MAPTDDELNLFVSIFLLLFSRRLTTFFLAYLFLRRARRRRIQFRVLQTLRVLYLHCHHRHQLAARRRPRTAWVFLPSQNWFQGLLNNQALEFWWKENFRVSRETFDHISRLVGPNLQRQDTRLREAIPVPKRVAVSIWRLATGECYRSCGMVVGLAKPTAVKCCHEFVREICRLQDEFIKFPVTAEEISQKIRGFNRKSKIPNVVAAIDGSHIPIAVPKVNHEDYFNRKHFYSVLVQGIVDSSGLFLSVAAGFPGSLHDARMLRLTNVYWAAEDETILMEPTKSLRGTVVRPIVVGDTAYPNRTWLIRPFKQTGRLSPEKVRFNKEVAKARIVVEHAYGYTKGRWRVLQKRLDEDTDRVPDTIVACCVLHNICLLANDDTEIDPFDSDDDDNSDDENEAGPPIRDANEIVQAIVQYIAEN